MLLPAFRSLDAKKVTQPQNGHGESGKTELPWRLDYVEHASTRDSAENRSRYPDDCSVDVMRFTRHWSCSLGYVK